MRQALLVIDVQESFRRRPYWRSEEVPAFIAKLQALIDRCQSRGVPVLQVFHQELTHDASDPFTAESGFVRTLGGLSLAPEAVFRKHVHSALFARAADGTTLETWLRERGIEEVIVTGIRTEQCCETTARHASDSGFRVRYVTEATLTFPMQSKSGRSFSTADLRERTELVLDGRFAQIVSAADALE